MARKRIGVFMSEIAQFYQAACGKAIVDMAALRDMDVVIFASFGSYTSPYGRNLLTETGKRNIIHLPDFSKLDAIIAFPATFDIHGMDEEFYSLLREKATCPVICLQVGNPDFYTVSLENKSSMYKMTRHFIEVHQFTDICYMSGPFQHKDSPDRLLGFVEAMRDSGLSINANTIYEGNYWRNRGAKALDFFMQDRRSYPQAIICANDYMALSIIEELKNRDVRVPEDVCVSGFDGIQEGEDTTPSLSTICVRPEKYAEEAFRILDEISSGKKPEKNIIISDEVHFRASCGCGKQVVRRGIEEIYHSMAEQEFLLRECGRITADYQNSYDIDSTLSVANYYFHTLGCDTGFICYCDDSEEDFFSVEKSQPFTDKILLLQIMHAENRRQAEAKNQTFSRGDILPSEYFQTEEPGVYIVLPIYFKNIDYGYLVLKPRQDQWPNFIMNTYISTLSGALENCYYQKKFSVIAEITKQSMTDSMTGLYNRRGFENALQDILVNKDDSMTIHIVSIDMDNLKEINDVYGHADGDFALTTLANVVRDCLSGSEFCARFGGDEFTAVLQSANPDHAQIFESRFTEAMEEASKSSGKPYPIHVSVGIAELKGNDTIDIVNCMREADEQMYIHKRAYKKERNG